MKLIKEKSAEIYLLDTHVENIVINEYIPSAPGDYVKIYIYALFYAEHQLEMNNAMIAQQLGLEQEVVKKAWTYWEEVGLIKKTHYEQDNDFNYDIMFTSAKAMLYNKNQTKKATSDKIGNIFERQEVQELINEIEKIFGRTMIHSELEKIRSWVVDYNIKPEVIYFSLIYAAGKEKFNIKYMEMILMTWRRENCFSLDDVKTYVDKTEQRQLEYKRVFKALGFSRNITESEAQIVDKWFDVYKFDMEAVLSACAKTTGIPNPNINYVNKVLENSVEKSQSGEKWKLPTEGVKKQKVNLKEYLEYLRNKAENDGMARKDMIYRTMPQIKNLDERIRELSIKLSKTLIMGDSDGEKARAISHEMEGLSQERTEMLVSNGYSNNYTEINYLCNLCDDTGTTDLGEQCSCIKERIEEAKKWQEIK